MYSAGVFSPLLYLFSSTSTWESRCEEKGSSYLFYFQTALAFNCSLLLLATGRFRPETYFCLLKDFFFPVGARNVFLLTKRFVSVGGGRGLRTDTDPQQKLPFVWISCTEYVYFVKHIYFKVFEFIIGGKNKTGVLFLSAV